jgi:hypothetical protein
MLSWRPVTSTEFEESSASSDAMQVEEAGREEKWEKFRAEYYMATFSRGDERLQAVVEITPEYPIRPPQFRLRLLKLPQFEFPANVRDKADPNALTALAALKGKTFNAALRDLEAEVNAHVPYSSTSQEEQLYVLAAQLKTIQALFDVLVDTEGNAAEMRGKIALRNAKGRDRSRPFHFSPQLGLFDFAFHPAPK